MCAIMVHHAEQQAVTLWQQDSEQSKTLRGDTERRGGREKKMHRGRWDTQFKTSWKSVTHYVDLGLSYYVNVLLPVSVGRINSTIL